MTVNNTCQVCENVLHVIGDMLAMNSAEAAASRMTVDLYLSVGDWSRSYCVCESCARRLIAELDSFVNDSRAFTQPTLGELQERLDSVKRAK